MTECALNNMPVNALLKILISSFYIIVATLLLWHQIDSEPVEQTLNTTN